MTEEGGWNVVVTVKKAVVVTVKKAVDGLGGHVEVSV
jgi:hypothetical protein